MTVFFGPPPKPLHRSSSPTLVLIFPQLVPALLKLDVPLHDITPYDKRGDVEATRQAASRYDDSAPYV